MNMYTYMCTYSFVYTYMCTYSFLNKYIYVYKNEYVHIYVYTKEKIGFNIDPRFRMGRAPNNLEGLRLYPMHTEHQCESDSFNIESGCRH